MRALRETAARAPPERFPRAEGRSGSRVDLAEGDSRVGILDHIAFPVFEVQRRVDALLLEPDRLAPWAGRVGRRDHKIATVTYVGRYHIECAFVVTDSRRVYSEPHARLLKRQLRGSVENVAYLLPVLEVAAVVDRHSGEIMEGRVDYVVVFAHRHHGGIGVEAGDYRVMELNFYSCGGCFCVGAGGNQYREGQKRC